MKTRPNPHGIAAEFDDAGELLAAARAARAEGYRRFEAYSPYPIKELSAVIPGFDLIPTITFLVALAGGFIGFYMQFFVAVDAYPTNIGGRPLNSWPAFVVIAFELFVLFAAIALFLTTIFFQRLPSLYHPLFRIPTFKRVTSDGFFLCIEARDGKFHPRYTAAFLQSLDPVKVWEVDHE